MKSPLSLKLSGQPLAASTKNKLALFCHVPSEHCLGAPAIAAAAAARGARLY